MFETFSQMRSFRRCKAGIIVSTKAKRNRVDVGWRCRMGRWEGVQKMNTKDVVWEMSGDSVVDTSASKVDLNLVNGVAGVNVNQICEVWVSEWIWCHFEILRWLVWSMQRHMSKPSLRWSGRRKRKDTGEPGSTIPRPFSIWWWSFISLTIYYRQTP